ncbi:transcriptional regulator [Micromonospora sp. KC606]|nr:transcriptional regulator [Micromonospora sp. KC606]
MSVHLGAAASRSSLAAAAQGRSLPSWETTWEFVRVLAVDRLGHDPVAVEKEWRQRWTRVKVARNLTGSSPAADAVPAVGTMPEPPGTTELGTIRLRGHRHLVAVVAGALAVLTGAVVFVVGHRRTASGDAGVPAAVSVTSDRDDSQFEGDITYPDGTLVPPNSSFTKIWRIRNTGTVVWANRFLARVNADPCQTPQAVPIPQTRPGEVVDIAVAVRTPNAPGTCKIYWKMADEQGRTLFPLKRPVFLDVQVGSS